MGMKAFFLLSLLLCLTISLAESRRWGGGHGGWDHGGHGGWDDSWEDGWDDGNWDDWWKDQSMEDCKASMEAQCKQMCQSMGPNEKCSGQCQGDWTPPTWINFTCKDLQPAQPTTASTPPRPTTASTATTTTPQVAPDGSTIRSQKV